MHSFIVESRAARSLDLSILVALKVGNELNVVMLNRRVVLRAAILTAPMDDGSPHCFLIHPPPSHTVLSSSSIGVATMTGDQSRALRVGARVYWGEDKNDRGTVTEQNWSGVTLKWDSRDEQPVLHNDMEMVFLISEKLIS
jgi:hypothetical protein